jgi:hypothetical protein
MNYRTVALIITVFGLGAITSSIGGMWHPYVTVEIKNLNQQPIKNLEVRFQNTEGKGVFQLYMDESLKTGEEMKFHFYVESEGAFALKATLANEQIVEGIGGYIERGNRKVLEVQLDRIIVAR